MGHWYAARVLVGVLQVVDENGNVVKDYMPYPIDQLVSEMDWGDVISYRVCEYLKYDVRHSKNKAIKKRDLNKIAVSKIF